MTSGDELAFKDGQPQALTGGVLQQRYRAFIVVVSWVLGETPN